MTVLKVVPASVDDFVSASPVTVPTDIKQSITAYSGRFARGVVTAHVSPIRADNQFVAPPFTFGTIALVTFTREGVTEAFKVDVANGSTFTIVAEAMTITLQNRYAPIGVAPPVFGVTVGPGNTSHARPQFTDFWIGPAIPDIQVPFRAVALTPYMFINPAGNFDCSLYANGQPVVVYTVSSGAIPTQIPLPGNVNTIRLQPAGVPVAANGQVLFELDL